MSALGTKLPSSAPGLLSDQLASSPSLTLDSFKIGVRFSSLGFSVRVTSGFLTASGQGETVVARGAKQPPFSYHPLELCIYRAPPGKLTHRNSDICLSVHGREIAHQNSYPSSGVDSVMTPN